MCVSYDFSETQRLGATGAIGNFYYPMKPSDQTNPSRVEVLLDIGPGLEDVVVKADATGLRRLVYNLVTSMIFCSCRSARSDWFCLCTANNS